MILNRGDNAVLDEPVFNSLFSESTRPKQFELPAMTELYTTIPPLLYTVGDTTIEVKPFGEKHKTFKKDWSGENKGSSSSEEIWIRLFIPKAIPLAPVYYNMSRLLRLLTPLKCTSFGKKKDEYICQRIPTLSKKTMQIRKLFIK